jgi:glycosyltransferase involved in cell wall biosynthesis
VEVLFVGGDFERKGGPGLLAWAERNLANVHLTVVTRDEIRNTPSNVTVRHGIGPNSPELIALYQASHIFALPTVGDCYSMVAMEAMACGVPVVISDIGGIRDIVVDGQTGYLCKPGDTAAFTAKLDTLVADTELRNRMAATARSRATEAFDARDCAHRLGDIIAECLSTQSPKLRVA